MTDRIHRGCKQQRKQEQGRFQYHKQKSTDASVKIGESKESGVVKENQVVCMWTLSNI